MFLMLRSVFASQYQYRFALFTLLAALVAAALLTMKAQAMSNNSPSIKIDFAQPDEIQNWIIVNDTVMGGRSAARIEIEQGQMYFYGDLSLQNNGGFASTRRIGESKAWSNQRKISLTLKGDGRQYQFRLRTSKNWDGVAYVANFKTNGEQQTIVFSAADFTPQWRGRRVTNAPDLNFTDIQQIGFMLADKQPGRFQLAVKSIKQSTAVGK